MAHRNISACQVVGVLSLALLTAAQISPRHARNMTVYHLNPASAGAVPLNMDTGDVRGDLYFYLGQFLLPLECTDQSPEGRSHFDCDNPERVDPDLVVTKVDLQVDSRTTTYSACNLCNGTDPFTHKPCEVGTYVCDCNNYGQSGKCDPLKLGISNITANFAPHAPNATCESALTSACGSVKTDMSACMACVQLHKQSLNETCLDEKDLFGFCPNPWQNCNATSPEWGCWSENIPRKTGGFWYSTLKEGQCTEQSAMNTCSWKVLGMKTVKEECLKDVLMSRVETNGKDCFQTCGPRNTTSACWIQCFFDTVLGEGARHSVYKPLGGMPINEIEQGWTDAFLPKEQGGCEEVSMSSARSEFVI